MSKLVDELRADIPAYRVNYDVEGWATIAANNPEFNFVLGAAILINTLCDKSEELIAHIERLESNQRSPDMVEVPSWAFTPEGLEIIELMKKSHERLEGLLVQLKATQPQTIGASAVGIATQEMAQDGFVVVPKEPTQAMLDAAVPYPDHLGLTGDDAAEMKAATRADQIYVRGLYVEMIKAAQQADKGE